MNYSTMDGTEPTRAPAAPAAVIAGRYRTVRHLGAGGMGDVWLVEDTLLDGRPFAVKMLPSILFSNKSAYAQLKAEALVSMKLVHPNIVILRDFNEVGGSPFLLMDYVDGETLADYLAGKGGTLSAGETVRILTPVAQALDYAHSQNVVHRDVKPGNVMIARDGKPYVLDFGIAREVQETLTRVTNRISSGTLLYMSPEQLRGAAAKPAQDVYSFAAMAYECLAGRAPFFRGKIDYQIVNEPPPPLPPDAAPEWLAKSIMAGLSKKPEERPASCMAMMGANEKCRMANEKCRIENEKWRMENGGGEIEVERTPRHGKVRELELGNGVTMPMIYVQPGEFMMGGNANADEKPVHRVQITKGFWLGKYPVTQRQWHAVMGTNPSYFKDDDLPVESVSWEDCQNFAKKAAYAAMRMLGKAGVARLPTEAEWEYACRAGTDEDYAGNGSLDDMGWYLNNSKISIDGMKRIAKQAFLETGGLSTHPVGLKRPNAWGFHDMHGNVWEWCEDWYGSDYYKSSPEADPKGPATGWGRVLRGGGWSNFAGSCRSASRRRRDPGYRFGDFGFRLACSAGLLD